jgi:hypothetical protein
VAFSNGICKLEEGAFVSWHRADREPRKLQRATAVLIFLEKTIELLSSSATDAEDGEEALHCIADSSMHGPWRWTEEEALHCIADSSTWTMEMDRGRSIHPS